MALLVVVRSHFLDNNSVAGKIPRAVSKTELYNLPKPRFGGLGIDNQNNSAKSYSRDINNGWTYRVFILFRIILSNCDEKKVFIKIKH
jgi:hypothetical protein